MQYTVIVAAVLIGTSLGSKALAQSAMDIRGHRRWSPLKSSRRLAQLSTSQPPKP
jgi:hypothetical protein